MTPRETRKAFGLTQAEFAALIGVSRPTIARAEAEMGDQVMAPWLLTLYRLIDALGPEAARRAIAGAERQSAEVSGNP